ncbi:MAG: UDP-N-acetylmuramate--L-alanine ligase [Actinomycetaceae bacterium]|nr:UDP-N-acetylmuramate--L-alanine ligase [Actinomycetaceae bacterium]
MSVNTNGTKKFHLIGIGGAGMSVVAQLLASSGHQVSGSDQSDSKTLAALRGKGINAVSGHQDNNVPADAIVVVSSAVRETNPELKIARQRSQQVWHRSQALAYAAEGKDFIAVAGAHGKTTTSGMLASALTDAGLDPSFAVGGVVLGFATGAHLGQGSAFVAEADESDGSFLNYQPRIAIVTNVEPDHLDHYGSVEAFEEAFAKFADRIKDGGLLIACSDDPGARRLALACQGRLRVWTYGLESAQQAQVPPLTHTQILTPNARAEGIEATLQVGEETGGQTQPLKLGVTGVHNLLNATAAYLAGRELQVESEQMATSLGKFTGTGRRFELRLEHENKRLFDDYAHHPSEVEAAVAQARLVAGAGKVRILFQPHLYSRTRNFAGRFAQALSGADQVILTDIYGAREDPIAGVSSELIAAQLPGATVIADRYRAARALAESAQSHDVCVTMGAGNVTECSSEFEKVWHAQP